MRFLHAIQFRVNCSTQTGTTAETVETKRRQIKAMPEVETTKLLVLGQGVIKTAHGATAVGIAGIEPGIEKKYSTVAEKITQGAYLEETDKNTIVIGHLLAKRLKVKVGKKVVLSTNNQHGRALGTGRRTG